MTQLQLNKVRSSLGVLIKTKREAKNLSKTRLAQLAGIHRNSLINAENGKNWLGMEQFVKIAEILEINLNFKN